MGLERLEAHEELPRPGASGRADASFTLEAVAHDDPGRRLSDRSLRWRLGRRTLLADTALSHLRIRRDMLRCVRTTITFDPDVAAELSRRRRHDGPTLRADVNDLIRLGLARERERGQASPEPFRTPTFRTGELRFPVDDVAAAITHAEGEDHR